MNFNKNKNQKTNTVKGTPRVTSVRAVNLENRPSLLGFANVIYKGRLFLNNIVVREREDGEAYLTFPAKKRVGKDGKDVIDENTNRPIYDEYYGPADKETREYIEKKVFDAVQDAIDGVEPPKTEKGEEKVFVHLLDGDNGAIALVSGVFEGKFFLTNISINQVGDNDAFLSMPARRRMKNGEPVKDENGKDIYDNYFGPATSDARKELEDMIFPALQEEMDKEEE